MEELTPDQALTMQANRMADDMENGCGLDRDSVVRMIRRLNERCAELRATDGPPVGWMRRWAFLGQARPADDRGKFIKMSQERCCADDVALYVKEHKT